MLNHVKELRKELHQYPELSGEERHTAKRVQEFIKRHHETQIITELAGHGIAAIYEFGEGPTVMLRCELDALPIVEPNTFDYKSTLEGVSHKCGHDGHMAMLAGLIFWLKSQVSINGKVVLLFQPAEETGAGAGAVLQDEKFKDIKPDYVFALHNIPGMPMHQIIPIQHNFSPAVQSISIHLKGKVSHACEPEKGINPAVSISKIISAFEVLTLNDTKDENYTVFTPIHINMGEIAYGISAGIGEVHYTFRTWKEERMTFLKEEIKRLLKTICTEENLEYTVNWFDYFPASVNDDFCNSVVIASAKKHNLNIKEEAEPFKFGEDFGWFTRDYKAAMFGLGSGVDTPALHHEDYDFPDELLETGIKMFQGIVEELLIIEEK